MNQSGCSTVGMKVVNKGGGIGKEWMSKQANESGLRCSKERRFKGINGVVNRSFMCIIECIIVVVRKS